MEPKIWGPEAWFFLHTITLEYPNKPTNVDKNNMKNFFVSLEHVLPCSKCKLNFGKHLIKHPLNNEVLSSKTKLVKWLIDIHNDVNKINGKQIMSYEVALKTILERYENKGLGYNIWMLIFIITIFVVIGIVLVWNKYYNNV